MTVPDSITLRAYTVRELDHLRNVVRMRLTYGTSNPRSGSSGLIPSHENVEHVVRTHMIAGHTAEDLMKADKTE